MVAGKTAEPPACLGTQRPDFFSRQTSCWPTLLPPEPRPLLLTAATADPPAADPPAADSSSIALLARSMCSWLGWLHVGKGQGCKCRLPLTQSTCGA